MRINRDKTYEKSETLYENKSKSKKNLHLKIKTEHFAEPFDTIKTGKIDI